MVAELRFPDDAAQVQDVAFSPDGGELYAVATINGKDSLFAVAGINGTAHDWKGNSVICDVQLKTLATRTRAPGRVYAAGKGKGVYEINVGNVQPDIKPILPFNAAGHLVIVEKGSQSFAFLTARTQGLSPNVYDLVLRFDLLQQSPMQTFHVRIDGEQLTGQDDIAVDFDSSPPRLYVVTNPPQNSDNKHLLIFDARGETAGPVNHVDLEENTAIRLAFNKVTNFLMVTYADSYRVRLVGSVGVAAAGLPPSLIQGFRHPVQVSPMSIAVAQDPRADEGARVYVLNSSSNTINAVPATRFDPTRQIPLQPLVEYRAAVLEAFVRLFGGLLQYLKDCLCDHLLVNCPECDEDDKIYLACVELRGGSIYKICNFSKRKYVKSFPTVEYWLSAVPVLPLIGKAVEAFCCAVLPQWFGRYTASRTSQQPNSLSSAMMQVAASALKGGGARALLGRKFGAFGDAFTNFLRDWFFCAGQEGEGVQGLAKEDIVGRSVEDVQRDTHGFAVRVVGVDEYDPCDGFQNFARLLLAPSRLSEGTQIRLVVQDGTVRNFETVSGFAERSGPAPEDEGLKEEDTADAGQSASFRTGGADGATAAPSTSSAEVEGLRADFETLRKEFDRARTEYAQNLASRDETIARLEANARDLQASLGALEELKQQVGALTQTKGRAPRKTKS